MDQIPHAGSLLNYVIEQRINFCFLRLSNRLKRNKKRPGEFCQVFFVAFNAFQHSFEMPVFH
jgi:hypothetical protein